MLLKGAEVIRRTDTAGPFGGYAASFTPGATAADGTYYYIPYVENADVIIGNDFKKMYRATDFIDIAEVPVSEQYRYRLSNTTAGSDKDLLRSWIFN